MPADNRPVKCPGLLSYEEWLLAEGVAATMEATVASLPYAGRTARRAEFALLVVLNARPGTMPVQVAWVDDNKVKQCSDTACFGAYDIYDTRHRLWLAAGAVPGDATQQAWHGTTSKIKAALAAQGLSVDDTCCEKIPASAFGHTTKGTSTNMYPWFVHWK